MSKGTLSSAEAFELISKSLASDEAGRKKAIKDGNDIFAFKLKNGSNIETWWIDLKKTGTVGKGDPPEAAGVTLNLSEADFGKLIAGKANAATLWMGKKLKVDGPVAKATKIEPLLKRARAGAKL